MAIFNPSEIYQFAIKIEENGETFSIVGRIAWMTRNNVKRID